MNFSFFASKYRKTLRLGLNQVYTTPNPQVDIVFVYEPNGHPYNTWESTDSDTLWVTDLLPGALSSQVDVRIFTFKYDAGILNFSDRITYHQAGVLIYDLTMNRKLNNCSTRPIIFVCHSTCSKVVKCTLHNETLYHEGALAEHIRSVKTSTFAILSVETPGLNMYMAKLNILLQSVYHYSSPLYLIQYLDLINAFRAKNEITQAIDKLFSEDMNPYRMYYFCETLKQALEATGNSLST